MQSDSKYKKLKLLTWIIDRSRLVSKLHKSKNMTIVREGEMQIYIAFHHYNNSHSHISKLFSDCYEDIIRKCDPMHYLPTSVIVTVLMFN